MLCAVAISPVSAPVPWLPPSALVAQAQRLRFYPSVTVMATRFLSTSRMNTRKALRLMQATQEWRQAYFRDGPLTDDCLKEDPRVNSGLASGPGLATCAVRGSHNNYPLCSL